jgi:formylglycine-generating enzyme required for sulfatase activity/serine/threonine protein kinase
MASSNSSSDELIGQTIAGRYRIISRLGAGGMGVAYRAWDEQEGRPVVIKIPKKVFLEDPKFAERFNREIRLLQGLRHPHVVPIVDVGVHEGLPYVAMRFLPGGSLSDRRLRDDDGRTRPNPPGMLHLWLPAVADALDHVHANGVVHRDVKPGNIFFDAYWNAFLGDFGIAKIVEESDTFDREHTLTATNMGIGTTEYMAPEQFTPKAVIDGRVDQYALAVIVYEMLAGTRPFTGSTAHLIVEVTTQPAPRLDSRRAGLPWSLVEAVHRGLAKNPGERFNSCRELAYAVLEEVPLLVDEPDIARLLCPKCSNILKLPVSAAGRKGKCPKCQTEMKVANDLGALWLLDEARRQKHAAASVDAAAVEPEAVEAEQEADEAIEVFKPVSTTTPIGRNSRKKKKQISAEMILGGIAAVGLVLGVLVFANSGGGSNQKSRSNTPDSGFLDDALRTKPIEEERTYDHTLAEAQSTSNTPASEFLDEALKAGPQPKPLPLQTGIFLAELEIDTRAAHHFTNKTDETVGGKRYSNSIYVHPRIDTGQSRLTFSVDGTFDELRGGIGILDKSTVIASDQVFAILGDGRNLWESQPFRRTGRGDDFRVAVKGIKQLELITESKGSRYGAHCVWIDPQFVRQARIDGTASDILAQPPITNSIGMKFKLIPPGTFMMGSEGGEADEKPVHEVRLTKPFYIGVYEVTNSQWKAVMGVEPPSKRKDADRPVETVSWNDAVAFCRKLSEMADERAAARLYRLPTEAEWEYACRAGTTTKWACGDDDKTLGDFAWFGGKTGGQTQPVGQKLPNAWGLHDMHGNVWEWCGDWYGAYAAGAAADPIGPEVGSVRGPRGGCWSDSASSCRSANRLGRDPSFRLDRLGFRLAMSPSESMPPEAGDQAATAPEAGRAEQQAVASLNTPSDRTPGENQGGQRRSPALIVATDEGLQIIRSSGTAYDPPEKLSDLKGRLSQLDSRVFLFDGKAIAELDHRGEVVRSTSLPDGVKGLEAVPLTGSRFAVIDNRADKVQIIDNGGVLISQYNLSESPNKHLQNVSAVEVGENLLVSEDGSNRLMQIPLQSGGQPTFLDLRQLPRPLGRIAWHDGFYFLAAGGREIYSFKETGKEQRLATLPQGNITGLVIIDGYAFVTVNFSGQLLRVELASGDVVEIARGLTKPKGLVLVLGAPAKRFPARDGAGF